MQVNNSSKPAKKMVVFVATDKMRVVLEILNYDKKFLTDKSSITFKEIVSCITNNKITTPINEEIIQAAIDTQDDPTPRSYVITEGKAVKPGKPRELKIFLSDKPSAIPPMAAQNTAEEEKASSLKMVNKGELIGEEIPPVLPQHGTNIFGIPVPAPKLKDEAPRPKKNVRQKGNKLYSTIKGVLFLNKKEINVLPAQIVEKSISKLKKKISSKGAIIVRGSIKMCNFIKSGVLVCKNIQMSEIETTDDVIVLGKVFNSTINCGGSIYAEEILSSNISAQNDVVVTKAIGKTEINAGGKVICRNKGIYSSTIKAKYHVDTNDMGNLRGEVNEVTIGGNFQYSDRVPLVQEKIKKCEVNKLNIENKLHLEYAKSRGRFPHERVDKQIHLNSLEKELMVIDNEIKILELKESILLKIFNKTKHMVYMRVRGVATPGNVINGTYCNLTIKSNLKAFQAMETPVKKINNSRISPKYVMSIFSNLRDKK